MDESANRAVVGVVEVGVIANARMWMWLCVGVGVGVGASVCGCVGGWRCGFGLKII